MNNGALRLKSNKKKITKPEKTSAKQKKANPLTEGKSIISDKVVQTNDSAQQSPALLFITGESPMVEQYAELCATHGFNICVSWNEQPLQKPEFKSSDIKISSAISEKTSLAIELTNIDLLAKKKNLERMDKALPDTAPILSSSITVTATEQSSWISRKHRLAGIAAMPTFIEKPLVEVAPTIYSPKETIEVVKRFFLSLDKEIEIVQDRIGMVFPRILCQVINEAAFAVTEDIATPQDIDMALKLGIQFPLGPIEWAEKIGLEQVYAVLTALYSDLQEERYRVAPLLKQMAITGEWWKQISLTKQEMIL
jgi:3-hydroxybutyryl-CoA dehydrogenase